MTAAVSVDALGTQMSVDPIWGKEGERSLIFQRFIPENYIKLLNCGAGVTFIDASSNRQFVWAKSILNVDPSPSFAAALVTQSCPPVNYTSLIGWYWLNISLQTASKIEETENSVSLDCFLQLWPVIVAIEFVDIMSINLVFRDFDFWREKQLWWL